MLSNLNNFHSLEVVDRVSETQHQVGENFDCLIWRLQVDNNRSSEFRLISLARYQIHQKYIVFFLKYIVCNIYLHSHDEKIK